MRTISLVVILVLFFAGCGSPKPAGLPDLIPHQVRIHDNGKPLEKVDISLLREEGQGAWSMGGITDSSGNATLRTIFASFEGSGVPVGTYRVILNKSVDYPPELILTEEQSMKLSPQELVPIENKRKKYEEEHRVLPPLVSDPEKSPITISVSKTNEVSDIDVSKHL